MIVTRVQSKSDTNDTNATRVKNFDFDNYMSDNIFSQPYISYMEQLEEQFDSKNYLLEMPHSHIKVQLKSAPQKLNFVMTET